jgi:hypothetical protein
MTARLFDMTSDGWEFHSPAGDDYLIRVPLVWINLMLDFAKSAGTRETGGILIGRYFPDEFTAEVAEVTPAPADSRAGPIWFDRGTAGLRDLLDTRWQSGLYYLGEWHYHPSASSRPSPDDRRTMRRIASNIAYQCATPLLLVLRGQPAGCWSLSATVFLDGAAHYLELRKPI